jgi:hypothetical protein
MTTMLTRAKSAIDGTLWAFAMFLANSLVTLSWFLEHVTAATSALQSDDRRRESTITLAENQY